jgi:hypothetical protein
MHARIAGVLVCALLPLGPASAATKLSPAEIQSTFFNGMTFNAATPSGTKFKMTFTADGKAKRVPVGKRGGKADGEWRLDADGYCTTWKGGKPSCFTVEASDKNKWSVLKGSGVVAIWSK